MRNDKFLVEFINNLTTKDLFIGTWLLGAAVFGYLMWSYSKKANQRNFRENPKTGLNKGRSVDIQTKDNKKNKVTKS